MNFLSILLPRGLGDGNLKMYCVKALLFNFVIYRLERVSLAENNSICSEISGRINFGDHRIRVYFSNQIIFFLQPQEQSLDNAYSDGNYTPFVLGIRIHFKS